jgi:hypothetical protein
LLQLGAGAPSLVDELHAGGSFLAFRFLADGSLNGPGSGGAVRNKARRTPATWLAYAETGNLLFSRLKLEV